MQSLISYSQTRSILSRSLLYAAFYRRFFLRYVRLWREYHRLRGEKNALQKKYEKRLNAAKHDYESNVERLNEMLEAERHRARIREDEAIDRFFELAGTVGAKYATRDVDERISKLRYEPFKAKKRDDPLTADFSIDEKIRYDELRTHHFTAGLAEGYTDAELRQSWVNNQDQIVEDVRREVVTFAGDN